MDRGSAELWTLSITKTTVEQAWPLLDEGERHRAEQFLVPAPKAAFVATRGALRRLCAKYLKTEPGQLRFTTNPHGKPLLAGYELDFNVSHSGSVAVLGFAWQCAIGVDVERTARKGDLPRIASRFFHPEEAAAIQASANPAQAFFRCWTAKEAYVKALGLGLSLPLDSFCVSVDGKPNVLGDATWTLHGWKAAAGYQATAAVHGPVTFRHRTEPIF